MNSFEKSPQVEKSAELSIAELENRRSTLLHELGEAAHAQGGYPEEGLGFAEDVDSVRDAYMAVCDEIASAVIKRGIQQGAEAKQHEMEGL